jgi:response regulator RpfG family c-di-GMP phosphodiesterase
MSTPEKILFVDDDENILTSMRRSLGDRYDLRTAVSPVWAVQRLERDGPFAVVVADLRMPEMDGNELLAEVAEHYPDTVRVMLTGHADLEAAMEAVNRGRVFRFLTKPCLPSDLAHTLDAALEQHRLVRAERELLQGTLRGTIKLLTEVMSQANPEAAARCDRLKRLVRCMAEEIRYRDIWKVELAAMLSQLGCVSLPRAMLLKRYRGERLNEVEESIFTMHPRAGAGLLSHIPRLEGVAEIVSRQDVRYDRDEAAPLGAHMLRLAADYDTLEQQDRERDDILAALRDRGWYYPKLLDALEAALCADEGYGVRRLELKELRRGMVLDENVQATNDLLLMVKGQEIDQAALDKLRDFTAQCSIREPIRVRVPLGMLQGT